MLQVLILLLTAIVGAVSFNNWSSQQTLASADAVQREALARAFERAAVPVLREGIDLGKPGAQALEGVGFTPALAQAALDALAAQNVAPALVRARAVVCLLEGDAALAAWFDPATGAATGAAAVSQDTRTGLAAQGAQAPLALLALSVRGAAPGAADCEPARLFRATGDGVGTSLAASPQVLASVSYAQLRAGLSASPALRESMPTKAALDALVTDDAAALADGEVRAVLEDGALYAFDAGSGAWARVAGSVPTVAPAGTSCPRGYVYLGDTVLADGTVEPAFCVSAGEMTVYPNRSVYWWCNHPPSEQGRAGFYPYAGACSDYLNSNLTFTLVSFENARGYCKTYGERLITNRQWMALASSIALIPENWSSGVVGQGALYKGISGVVALADTDYSAVTSRCEYGNLRKFIQASTSVYACQRAGLPQASNAGIDTSTMRVVSSTVSRTHRLPNGQVIWDLAGNLAEWVDGTELDDTSPRVWMSGTRKYQNQTVKDFWTDSTNLPYLPAFGPTVAPPQAVVDAMLASGKFASSLALGMGAVRDGVFSTDNTDALSPNPSTAGFVRAALRGGGVAGNYPVAGYHTNSFAMEPGLFTFDRSVRVNLPGGASEAYAGFRCTRAPL